MTRWLTCNSGASSFGWAVTKMRSGIGNDSTHWRTGTGGDDVSTKRAAVSAMRRKPQEGQNPRHFAR